MLETQPWNLLEMQPIKYESSFSTNSIYCLHTKRLKFSETIFLCLLLQLRQAKTHIVSAGKGAYRFLAGVAPSTIAPESTESSTRGPTPRFKRPTRLKKLIPNGHKPTSPGPGDHNKNAAQHLQPKQDAE